MRIWIAIIFFLVICAEGFSQGCCSGGSGSPIAGGASQGVLQAGQMELAVNHQYLSSSRFLSGDRDTSLLFENLNSNYLYARLAYGVSKKLTMSVETGYFINKTQYGLERSDTVQSSGIADIILFPRYNLLTRNTDKVKTEVTVGLGFKMPVGKYNDSTVVYRDPRSQRNYYTTSPPTIQPTSGSQDFIFYAFWFRGYTEKKFRIFANMICIKKGWNPLGQKFGDYSSAAFFANQTFARKFSITMQVRGEFVSKMKYDKNVDMLALYNIDIHSTGSRKIFVAPQLSYSKGNIIVYAMYEYPLYQYLNGTQIGSQHQFTTGLSYRFLVRSDCEAE